MKLKRISKKSFGNEAILSQKVLDSYKMDYKNRPEVPQLSSWRL